MKGKKLIIVDFDGPLNSLSKAKLKTVKILSKKFGIEFSDLAAKSLLVYVDQIYENQRITDYKKIVNIGLNKLVKNKLIKSSDGQIDSFSNSFSETVNNNVVLNEDLLVRLQKIKKRENTNLCIYSTQKKDLIIKFLSGFANLFDEIYTTDDFDELKPSVSNLTKICDKYKIDPKEAVIIGDNVAVDLMPAKYLGMKTVLYTNLVDKTIQSGKELDDILSNI